MIVIPMAGASSRFFKAGYDRPKYMLPLGPRHGGKTLFHASIESFAAYFATDDFCFIYRDGPDVAAFIHAALDDLGLARARRFLVPVTAPTTGQAETVAIGLKAVGCAGDEPLFIFNIDTLRPGFRKPGCIHDQKVAGYLEVAKADGDHWSFAALGSDGKVNRVAEKQRISDLCSTGIYYFARAADYLAAFEKTADADPDTLDGGERYVAPLYNNLIARGNCVVVDRIDLSDVVFSGTPAEYRALCARAT